MANYKQLAQEWQTTAGTLSTLGGEIGLPYGVKEELSSEQVANLEKAFKASKAEDSSSSIAPQLPAANPALQAPSAPSGIELPEPSGTPATSHLEAAHQRAIGAAAARAEQANDLLDSRIAQIIDRNYEQGVLEALVSQQARHTGAIAAMQMLAVADEKNLAALHETAASKLAQGIENLSDYLGHKEVLKAAPGKYQTVAQKNLEALQKLSES